MAAGMGVDQYDYVRVAVADICGTSRGKIVPGSHAADIFRKGLPMFSGILIYGPRGEIPEIPRLVAAGYPNGVLIPDQETLHPVPWSGYDKYKVGEVFCEMHWAQIDGSIIPQDTCPRYVAQKQIGRLNDMGYNLMSSFEMEFMVVDKKTEKPVFSSNDFGSHLTQAKNERFLFSLDKNFREAGLDINVFHAEYAPGQFEFCFEPSLNIRAADEVMLFKDGVKQIADQQGLQAIFMTKPFLNTAANAAHYNHSLILQANGKNAFHDEAADEKLSDVAHHWLAGLVNHAGALTALNAPTVNCYRRFHGPWAPYAAYWGIDDRTATYRAKHASSEISYMENRLPGGSSNPYLVLASTVAAGIDGIQNRLECPPPGKEKSTPEIARSLEEALQALENDSVMVESLGAEFVDWFVQIKRKVDLKKCPHPLDHNDIGTEYEEYVEFS